jgi:hypothetical protein
LADAARYLPGLDLANEVRRLYDRGEKIEATKRVRDALGCDLTGAVEWMAALTGWRPGQRAVEARDFGSQAITVEDMLNLARKLSVDATNRYESTGDAIGAMLGDKFRIKP